MGEFLLVIAVFYHKISQSLSILRNDEFIKKVRFQECVISNE